ncbi:Cytochrome P450 [Nakamurella panacisegetis]|uniref:Cytochrome P450 n=1 Tax=Nakamurella panacisegetis TaxID=1090615 RepID=A0A1H0IC44_9ACTN|nr:cytochrome P450 [Nakamurella panacisegetis]SDO28830.1 Cytochrome P450 [Nakamurella panacisegetis]
MTAPTVEQLTTDPHPALATLRRDGPIAWVESIGGWMVVGHGLATAVMRDPERFTVDDPRFTTSRVVGASMLSTDGADHTRHRQPFVSPFSPRASRAHFAEFVARESARLVGGLAGTGTAELRTELAAPLATACMQMALGLEQIPVTELLSWYGDIVSAVADITAGAPLPDSGRTAYASLSGAVLEATRTGHGFLREVADAAGALTTAEMLANTAVLLFGGIETTEGMIANLLLHLLADPSLVDQVRSEPGLLDAAIEESLRLEPAAAVVDRYATEDVRIDDVVIRRGDLVVVSLAGANRDPAVFPEPDRFDPRRDNLRRQLAFAQGPHVCIGLHVARLQARSAATAVLGLPKVRLDRSGTCAPTGLVFRKPASVRARWDT